MSIVLAFSCTHEPFSKKGYLAFIKQVYKDFNCNAVVCLGDEMDFHRVSFHDPEPDAKGAVEEYDEALEKMKDYYKAFPKCKVCFSNHTSRPFRLAAKAGLPSVFVKEYREFMKAPKGWEWQSEWEVDDVIYTHGEGFGGAIPHLTAVMKRMQSIVIGHHHRCGGVEYIANPKQRIFGASTGCGIDAKLYAFRYAKNTTTKPMIGCVVVIDGKEAHYIPMELGRRVK